MMRLFANITSIILHPLLMVTYGVLLAITYTYLAIYPDITKLYLVGGVFISTALVPGLLVFLLVKSGGAQDLELTDRRERVIPYLIFIASNLVCVFYMSKMQTPLWLIMLLIGVCVALFISLCINFFWKISAHAMGVGGLLGAVMGLSQVHQMNPYWLFIALFIAGGLVGTSRIILRKHTPMQVYAGFSLGFICTFVSSTYMYLLIII